MFCFIGSGSAITTRNAMPMAGAWRRCQRCAENSTTSMTLSTTWKWTSKAPNGPFCSAGFRTEICPGSSSWPWKSTWKSPTPFRGNIASSASWSLPDSSAFFRDPIPGPPAFISTSLMLAIPVATSWPGIIRNSLRLIQPINCETFGFGFDTYVNVFVCHLSVTVPRWCVMCLIWEKMV